MKNVISESYLTDNEHELVYTIIYIDYTGKNAGTMNIHARNIDEASRLFRKYEGPKAQILHISKGTAAEWKEQVL